MKLEAHIHTKYSHDSLMCFWSLYMQCRFNRIDYVAITDHNTIEGAIKFQKYCEKRGNKVKVIIGEEIMTSQGELIGLYLTSPIQSGMSAKETILVIRKQGGIIYIPHPYDEKRKRTVFDESALAEYCLQIDCIECYNGRNISSVYGKIQNELAEKYSIPKVIGSDSHTVFEIGRNYMNIIIEPTNADDFRAAIASASFHTARCIKICHTFTKIARIINLARNGEWHELNRAFYRAIARRMYRVGR